MAAPPIGVLGFTAAALLTAYAARRVQLSALVRMAGAAALAGALLGLFTWSLSTLVPAYAGTANDAYAGPPAPLSQNHAIERKYGVGLHSNGDADHTATVESDIFAYARARSGNRRYVLATDTWRSAAPLIMVGGRRVLPIGGYSSWVNAPSVAAIRQLVVGNSLKYILLTGPTSKNDVSTPTISAMHRWVQRSCRFVPESDYAGRVNESLTGRTDRLYECTSRVRDPMPRPASEIGW